MVQIPCHSYKDTGTGKNRTEINWQIDLPQYKIYVVPQYNHDNSNLHYMNFKIRTQEL